MVKVTTREVKGKTYYYLAKNIRIGKKVKTFTQYFGLNKPAKSDLKKLESKLNLKIEKFYVGELLLPNTEFIDIKTAKSIERIRQETQNFLSKLTAACTSVFLILGPTCPLPNPSTLLADSISSGAIATLSSIALSCWTIS